MQLCFFFLSWHCSQLPSIVIQLNCIFCIKYALILEMHISSVELTTRTFISHRSESSCRSFPVEPFAGYITSHVALTIAGHQRPVVSAVLVQLAAFGWSFAGRSLHEELVLVVAAVLGAIQRLALRLEGTPGLLSVRLSFTGDERGAVFGFRGGESPERVGLVVPTLRGGRAII